MYRITNYILVILFQLLSEVTRGGLGQKISPGLRVFKPEPNASRHTGMNCLPPPHINLTGPEPAGLVGFDPLMTLHVIKLPLPPSPNSPCIILTLLPAYRLYYTVPVSQPVTEDVEATAAPVNKSVILAHFAASTVRFFF